jgi:hypothetical protein
MQSNKTCLCLLALIAGQNLLSFSFYYDHFKKPDKLHSLWKTQDQQKTTFQTKFQVL